MELVVFSSRYDVKMIVHYLLVSTFLVELKYTHKLIERKILEE